MEVWRLIKLETRDGFTNMAIDEAIYTARIAGMVPNTLRFYRWNPSAVSIGRFQDVSREVYIENCEKHEVDIVRRITGGGSVYHDHEGEITYSIIVEGNELGPRNIDLVSAYKTICAGLIEAVRILGTTAEFTTLDRRHCPSVTIAGKKISGSSQALKKGILLQHGTFMVDINLEEMFTYLKVPWAKTLADVLTVSQRKLTSIRQELPSEQSMDEVYPALVKGFETALSIKLTEADLTRYETKLAEELRKNKFSTPNWNLNGTATR